MAQGGFDLYVSRHFLSHLAARPRSSSAAAVSQTTCRLKALSHARRPHVAPARSSTVADSRLRRATLRIIRQQEPGNC